MNQQQYYKMMLALGLAACAGTLYANSSFIQSTVGSGCSSVCINNRCTSTCNDDSAVEESSSGNLISKNIEFTAFDSVVVSGVNIELFQSDQYSIKLDTTQKVFDKLDITKKDKTLSISPMDNSVIDSKVNVLVGLPSLKSLSRTGTGSINLSHFRQSSLHLDLAGTGKLIGKDNTIENLSILTSGTVGLDFKRSDVTNAQVTARGVNNIALRFTGPKSTLSGELFGVSIVSYCGTPVNSISALGVSKTRKIECL